MSADDLAYAAEPLLAEMKKSREKYDQMTRDPDEFRRDKSDVPYANDQANIRLAITRLGHRLQHNTFADRLLIDGRFLDDPAMVRLWLSIDEQFGFRPGKDLFWSVTEDEARQHPFHPVRDYLDSLEWDREPRIETWLIRLAGAPDTPFVRAVSKLVLIAAVRRVRQPGCKFDEMMVLESSQGLNKSNALSILAVEPEWFSDDLPLDADTKRQIEALNGRLIVEASELQGMRQGDVEHLKAFLSRQVDRARLAYARRETEAPRQCVVIGTTNSAAYLKDATGNRRFWPVKIGKFDLEALKDERDQLWAEAVCYEKIETSIRLNPNLYVEAAEVQAERRVEDPFLVRLREVLGDRTGKMRTSVVWKYLDIPSGQQTQNHSCRIGEAMRELGWERIKLRFGAGRDVPPSWCYAKGTTEERSRIIEFNDLLFPHGSTRVPPVGNERNGDS